MKRKKAVMRKGRELSPAELKKLAAGLDAARGQIFEAQAVIGRKLAERGETGFYTKDIIA